MANIKRIVRIVALVAIEGPAESDINVIGGNLARQLQGAIPTQYDVRGVEVEGITDPEADSGEAEKTVNTSRKAGERDDGKAKVLTT